MIDTSHFCGTENWYRYEMLPGYTYTDGVRFVARQAQAYWLLDVIFSWQLDSRARREEFQVWRLTQVGDGARVTMTDGDSDQPVITQDIEATDFPFDEFRDGAVEMWLEGKVLMLPSER
jgi:hypothetical protein